MSSFKIVLRLRDISISDIPKENIEGKIEIAENIKYFKLPIKEVISFDLDQLKPSNNAIIATFFDSSNKKTLGSLNIAVPVDIYEKEEYELDKDFSIQTQQRSLQGHYFLAIFNRKYSQIMDSTLRNDNSFQETTLDNSRPQVASQKSVKIEKTEKPAPQTKTPEKSKTIETSKSKTAQHSKNSGSSAKKSNTAALNTSISSKVRVAKQDNVNQAINKSIGNAAQMAEAFNQDSKDITECLYLNKLNNTELNLEEIANEAKLSKNNRLNSDELKEMVPNRKELESYRETFDLSPEKLKARYRDLEKSADSGKRKGPHQRSMSPGNNDLDYSIVKNELWKYSNESKNQVSDNIRKENEMLKLELKKSEESRNDLQSSIRETTQELKNESFNMQKTFNKLMQDKTASDDKIKEMGKKLENALQNFENARNMSRNLENELKEARINLKNLDDIKIQNGYFKNHLQSKEQRIAELNDNFSNKLKDLQRTLQECEQQKDAFFQERVKLAGELNEARQKLEYEQNRLREKQNEADVLKRKNQLLMTAEALLKTTQEENKKSEDDLKDARNLIDTYNSLIEKLKMELINKSRETDDHDKRLTEKNNLLEQKLLALESKITEQNSLIATLQKNNSEAKNNISTLEQLLCLKEDVNNQLEFARDKVDKLTKENQDYKNQITLLTDQTMIQDNKTYDLQNMISHMREMINEKEEVDDDPFKC